MGVYGWAQLERAQEDEISHLQERVDEIVNEIRHEGLEELIENYSDEFGPLWPQQEAEYFIEESEVLLLVTVGERAVLGFAQLSADLGLSYSDYPIGDNLEDIVELRTLRVDFGDDITVSGGLARSDEIANAKSFIHQIAFWIFVVLLPLLLVYGFLLSGYVISQLRGLSHSLASVEGGNIEARAATSDSHDEFNQLALDVNKMLSQVGRLVRNLENVSVGVAHDLKTPLTKLDHRLQRIEHDLNSPDDIRVHVEASRSHLQTLLNTFNALLRLGEIESGRRRDQFRKISLSEITEDVADTFQAVFSEQGRTLDVSIIPEISIDGDADLLAQLVSNLLENVLDHAKAGGTAWVRLQRNTSGAVMQIGDDGPGIPAPEHARIFERFYRLDKSRQAPGNGLGLSLVASIAQLHGATISLHKDQPGTVFDIVFKT